MIPLQQLDDCSLKLEYEDILEYLKNRPPFLMIRNAIVIPGVSSCAEVELSGDEWFFPCHFPGDPLMPGALQLETFFNTAALAIKTLDGKKKMTSNINRVKNAFFHFPLRPGMHLSVETVVVKKYRHGVAWFSGKIVTHGELACEADFSLTVPEEMIMLRKES